MGDAKDPDAILAALLAVYPASADGRWAKIAEEFASSFGEAKSAMWLRNRAKKLEKAGGSASEAGGRQDGTPPKSETDGCGDVAFPPEVRGCVRAFTGARGRGLQCVRDVKKGDVLIGIPKKWALETTANRSGACSGQIELARQLLDLRRKNDFRVRHLPASCDMPCYWSAEELGWLKGSHVYGPACNQRATLRQMYPGSWKKLGFSEEAFIWAMCMVQSRQFGDGDTMIFLPFVDLISSSAAPDLRLDIRVAGGYVNIHASRDFKEGEEALVSYHGEAPDLFKNFLGYGFVPEVVSTPPLPLDPGASARELAGDLGTWEAHLRGLSAQASGLADPSDTPPRKAVASQLLRHERKMTIEHIVHIKQLMAKLEAKGAN